MLGNNALRVPRSVDQVKGEVAIVIDTREKEPLVFSKFQSVCGTLITGDYSVLGLESQFSVERKSIADLVACCVGENRERFERELHRLRGFRFKRLLIVGSEENILAGRYLSQIKPNAVMATLGAFEMRYRCPVVFKPSPEAAARQSERWAYWFAREIILSSTRLERAAREVVKP